MPDASGFWSVLETLHFLRPAWLAALLPVALLVWMQARVDDPLKRFGGLIAPHLLEHLVVKPGGGGSRFRPLHLIAGMLVVSIVATAGPTWRRQPSPFAADTAPVMVALDLSQAMDAIDLAPSRLERAKQKVRDLLDGRPGAKTGLVAYAGSAHLVLPPTEDAAILTTFLDALSTSLMPLPGSDAATATDRALASLERQDVPGTVILVASTIDTDLEAMSTRLRGSPHQLLVLAVGTEAGGPIRRGDDDFVVEGGQRVLSRLDPAEFDALSDAAGAYVTRATVDDTDVRRLLRRTRNHLESALESDSTQEWEDSGYWLAWPVVLLGLFWFRRGWTVRWDQTLAAGLLTLMLVLPAGPPLGAQDEPSTGEAAGTVTGVPTTSWWADLWWTRDQQARRRFEQQQFAEAALLFEEPRWRGVAAYRAGNWDLAITAFAGLTDADGSFNLGNAYLRKGEYELAIAAYDQALLERPGWDAATTNRELALTLIPPEPEQAEGEGDPSFSADQIEFDLEEDQGEEGEVTMTAFSDEQVADMWLRQLTTSPAGFLRTKFAIQAARASDDQEGSR